MLSKANKKIATTLLGCVVLLACFIYIFQTYYVGGDRKKIKKQVNKIVDDVLDITDTIKIENHPYVWAFNIMKPSLLKIKKKAEKMKEKDLKKLRGYAKTIKKWAKKLAYNNFWDLSSVPTKNEIKKLMDKVENM